MMSDILMSLLFLQEVFILRTMTHSAAMGFISPRDFVDLVINQNTDEFVGTFGKF